MGGGSDSKECTSRQNIPPAYDTGRESGSRKGNCNFTTSLSGRSKDLPMEVCKRKYKVSLNHMMCRTEDDMETNFIWKERKRNALGLPWTFTKYALTDDRLFITSGLLKTVEDEGRLYRIMDLSLSQTLSQKIFGIGTILVSSADKSMRDFEIKNIKKPRDVKEQLSKLVEENRDKKRVTNREFMGEDAEFGDDDDR